MDFDGLGFHAKFWHQTLWWSKFGLATFGTRTCTFGHQTKHTWMPLPGSKRKSEKKNLSWAPSYKLSVRPSTQSPLGTGRLKAEDQH
jgi:hypothetical protein